MAFKTDIEIAQEAIMLPIMEIAKKLGITEDEVEQYGKYKAKIDLGVFDRLKDKKDGKLILVSPEKPQALLDALRAR